MYRYGLFVAIYLCVKLVLNSEEQFHAYKPEFTTTGQVFIFVFRKIL